MTSPHTPLCPPSASVSDGASLMEEDDNEQVEKFDFDDWDDTRPDMSHHRTEVSDLIKANKPETQAQDTARQDVNGLTSPRLKGKNSLYQQCTSSSGLEVRESPEGCSTSSDLTMIGECSWKANSPYEGKPSLEPDCCEDKFSSAAVNGPCPQECPQEDPQQELEETSSSSPLTENDTADEKEATPLSTVSCLPHRSEETGDPEVIYDDVPAETIHQPVDGDRGTDVEGIYEDIQGPVDLGSNSWSSNEFECFDDSSDGDAVLPTRSNSKSGGILLRSEFRTDIFEDCKDLLIYELPVTVLKLKEKNPVTRGKLPVNYCPPNVGSFRQSCDNKVQQLMKAARNGTKDGLEKTRLAMIRKVTFLQKKASTVEEQDDAGYMDVSVCELRHPPPKLCPMPEGLSSQQVVRRLILSSIVQSEISYLDSLKRILEEYQKPLLEQNWILSHKKVQQIFYRVQEIHQCHSMFQIALASRVSEWDQNERIGDLFVASFSKSMVLNVYSDYINNFTNAMALIKKACLSKPSFLDFLKKMQASSADRITLYGLMVKPIQRFPQFILLLQDMLKNTPKSHSDRLPLQLALTELETLADKLNKQKHLADQEAEIELITHSAGGRNLNKLLNSEHRQLIHCETLTEIVYSDKGQVLKSKERKVFLLNNTLICANVNLKGAPDVSTLVPVGPKYTVKWCCPLMQTEVVEVGQDTLQSRESVSIARRLGSTSSNTGNMFLGPPRLYQELEELEHDLDVVEKVSLMVGTLHGTYQNLNTTVSQDWCLALHRLIRLKEEEIQNANKCRLRLSIPSRPDRSGHPVSIMVVFNTPNPLSKISWVNRLYLAKIAQRQENIVGWKGAEEDGSTKAPFSCPLLTCKLPVLSSRAHTLKLEAALHSPAQSSLIGFCTASMSLPQGYLWVAGGGSNSNHGQVEIFSLNRTTPRLVKTIPVRAPVLCLEYVKEPCDSTEEREAGATPTAAKTGNIICVGLLDGSILVYSSVDTTVQCLLTFINPDSCPVLCLKHSHSVLFAGLANGKIALYHRGTGDRLWDVESCTLVSLGSEPVCCMLTIEDAVWASCVNQVTVIQESSLHKQTFQAHSDPCCSVTHMVQSGGGVWMAFSQSSSIHLFHTETLEHLQEVNISARTASLTTGQVCVSSLLICQGLLWVGTSQGIILCFPVPTLEGIPKITGKGMTSLNAHCGPVDFLMSISSTLASNLLKQDSILNGCSEGKCDVEVGECQQKPKQGSQNSEAPPPNLEKPVHLLQYHLRSTCQLPGKLLTAQPDQGNPNPPPDPLEHSPEDGSIYEVSEDPDVWVRGQPIQCGKDCDARRSKVISTAIFSGGRGHRRLGDAVSETASDSTENTLLVWQLPLTLSQ